MIVSPVRYSDDVETISPDETEVVNGLLASFDTILSRTAADHGHALRGVHAKSHGVLEGEMVIDANLPPELAQGIFAQPGTRKVTLRLSTNPGDILPDSISLPRGLALKVHDVAGPRLPGGGESAQDFLMVNGPVFLAKTAKQFAGNLKLLAKTTDRFEGGKRALSAVFGTLNSALAAVGRPSTLLAALGGAPKLHPLGATYYSTTAFRYGDYIAKFSLEPASDVLAALREKMVDTKGQPTALRQAVRDVFRESEAVWTFRVQLCRDLQKQPVEDPTVRWEEEDAPFARVATIRVPPQDSWEASRVVAVDERMYFSVWNGIEAHRPLGNVNRARRETYAHSRNVRARTNGCPVTG